MKVFRLLDEKTGKCFVLLSFLFLISAALETLGISFIIPIVTALSGGGMERLPGLMAAVFGVYLFKNLFLYCIEVLKARFFTRGYRRTARMLFEKYMRRPFGYFADVNSAVLSNNVNIYVSRVYAYAENLVSLAAEVFVIVIMVIYLCTVNAPVALAACGMFLALTFLFKGVLGKKLKDLGNEANKCYDRMSVTVRESFHGIREVKAFGTEDAILEKYDGLVAERSKLDVKNALLSNLPRHILELVTVCGMLLLIGFYARRPDADFASVTAQLAVFAVVLIRMIPGVNRINANLSRLNYDRATLDRLEEDLSAAAEKTAEPVEQPAKFSLQSGIEIKNLCFSYRQEAPVLDNLSLSVPKGSVIGIKGPSGEGKTTLINLLLGLYEPDSGEILADGTRVSRLGRSWQRALGYIPQNLFMLDGSMKENILFFRPENTERLQAVIRMARLRELAEALPEGIDTRIGERGAKLSGGQNQRIAIARALYGSPDILILDEATASLDNELEREVMEAIYGLEEEKTVIIVAHRDSALSGCHRVYELKDGRLQ